MTGRLTPGPDSLLLEGAVDGRPVKQDVAYRDISGIRIGRTLVERLNGKPTLVVERQGTQPLLVQPLGGGLLTELADLLVEVCAASERVERVAVVLPLKPGTIGAAAALVAEGPPFDPADTTLQRHEVFLSDREVVFIFFGADACESVLQIIRASSGWSSADRWGACLDGPPRLAELGYSWPPST